MDVREKTKAASTTDNTSEGQARGLSNAKRITLLVIGDVLVFLIFSAIGRRSHGEAAGLDALVQIAFTAAPFAIGWFIVSPFVGAFRRGLEVQPGKMALRTALAWVAAWPVGLLIRGLIEWKVPPLSFALVTLISNTVFLLIWRWPFALVNSMRRR
ncbi:MAG: DUF3054 domain-containing protein [Chloroflexi bacterium]|nr:DUF3054 domain-containing protein [Chloroflexota bacterium]